MADGAVFRVSSDVSDYVKGMTKAEQATKRVAKSAAGIGDQVTGSIVKVELLKRALDAAGRAIGGVLDKATSASKTAGERAIGMATSLASLGAKDINATISTLTSGKGATADQGAAFLKSLSSANKQRRSPLSSDQVDAFAGAYAEGGDLLYGEGGEGLTELAGKGYSAEDAKRKALEDRGNVFGALSDPTAPLAVGLRGRADDERARRAEEAQFLSSGASLRAQSAAGRVSAANDPGGPVSILSGILGDNAAGALNAAMPGSDRIKEQAARATISQAETMRRILTQPNLATDTK